MMVLGRVPAELSVSRNRARGSAYRWSPIESNPVSGPSSANIALLLLRRAPMCSCMVQPFSLFSRPISRSSPEASWSHSAAESCAPARTRSKIVLICMLPGQREETGGGRVIGEPAARPVKEIVARGERHDQIVVAPDLHIGDGGQPVHVAVPRDGIGERQQPARTPGGKHPGVEGFVGRNHRMVLQANRSDRRWCRRRSRCWFRSVNGRRGHSGAPPCSAPKPHPAVSALSRRSSI